jgi:hypothetical protein
MKIKTQYSYTNKKQLWRILPTQTNKIVIEERDTARKEVFFSCIKLENGKAVFKNFQFEEKYWIGIEAVYDDLVLFHKFVKPDLPQHQGLIVFDIQTQKIIWEDPDYNYLFLKDNKIYTYQNRFEGKEFFVLDLFTGEVVESLGDNSLAVNILKQSSYSESYFENFLFPETYTQQKDSEISNIIEKYKASTAIAGKIDYLVYRGILLFNYHEVQKNGSLKNKFTAIDIDTKKVIFKEILNAASSTIMPDSFFIVKDHLLLLKEKVRLIVCSFTG